MVGQHLVLLIERLGQAERGLGREAEARVGLALQRRQVVERAAAGGAGLALFGHRRRFAQHGFGDGLGLVFRPQAVGAALRIIVLLEGRVEPLALVLAGLGVEVGAQLPVVAGHVLADLFLALDDDGQGGVCTRPTVVRKKPPSRELKAVMARVPLMPTSQSASEGSGARRRPGQHLRIAAQLLETLADGGGRHGLQPQALDRFVELSRAGCAYCTISRKISSPSRPASQALIRAVTSLRRISLHRALSRVLFLSIGFRSKCGGMTGG